MCLAALNEVHPVTDAAGRSKGSNEARIVDQAVIQRVIADNEMGIRRGASSKGSQHTGNVRRMGAGRGPKGLSGKLPPDGTAQHAQKPAPDLAAGALRTVGLKTQRKMVPA